MSTVEIRSERHRVAVESYNRAYANFEAKCGRAHGFRASIPTISKAKVALCAAEREITAAVKEAKTG